MTPSTPPVKSGSGSPVGEPEYLAVGFLRRPHGVQGEILMNVHTDIPNSLKPDAKVFVGEAHSPMIISGVRPHGQGMLVSFVGINNPEEAGRYRNTYVYIMTSDRPPLPEGEYYHFQLVGLQVLDEDEQLLGDLTDILVTGANDVYVVTKADGRELLLPAIPAVILDVDLDAKQMHVHLLPGLIDEG